MNVKKGKKNLSLNKCTIRNLDINQGDVLAKDVQGVIKAGSDTVGVGVTLHPKYC